MTQPQAEMLDLYRAGLKNAADLLKTSLENAERLQNRQLVAIRTAIVEQAKTASEIGSARTMDELLSAQSRLAGVQVERVLGYWSELFQVAGQNQMAAIGQVQQQMTRMSETLAQAVTVTAGVKQAEKKQESRKAA
jgi:phasin family protein